MVQVQNMGTLIRWNGGGGVYLAVFGELGLHVCMYIYIYISMIREPRPKPPS